MPSRDHDTYYSTKTAKTHSDDLSDFDIDLPIDDGPDEVLLAGIGLPPAPVVRYFSRPLEPPSKKVTRRFRRSDRNDRDILDTIQDFVIPPTMTPERALVAILNPSHSLHSPYKASNDNHIPVWENTSDRVKLTFANEALEGAGRKAVSFTVDITPVVIAQAQRHPAGFTDSMARRFRRMLIAELGYEPLSWFSVDVSKAGHLHLHGGIASAAHEEEAVQRALRRTGGHKVNPARPDCMVHLNPQSCDDGWVKYAMKARGAVRKLIEGRTFTITGPLRAEARELYMDSRALMKALCR